MKEILRILNAFDWLQTNYPINCRMRKRQESDEKIISRLTQAETEMTAARGIMNEIWYEGSKGADCVKFELDSEEGKLLRRVSKNDLNYVTDYKAKRAVIEKSDYYAAIVETTRAATAQFTCAIIMQLAKHRKELWKKNGLMSKYTDASKYLTELKFRSGTVTYTHGEEDLMMRIKLMKKQSRQEEFESGAVYMGDKSSYPVYRIKGSLQYWTEYIAKGGEEKVAKVHEEAYQQERIDLLELSALYGAGY